MRIKGMKCVCCGESEIVFAIGLATDGFALIPVVLINPIPASLNVICGKPKCREMVARTNISLISALEKEAAHE